MSKTFGGTIQLILELVTNVFTFAVLVTAFLGISLVTICIRLAENPTWPWIMVLIACPILMLIVFAAVVLLRIYLPEGLMGPPKPATSDLEIADSTFTLDE